MKKIALFVALSILAVIGLTSCVKVGSDNVKFTNKYDHAALYNPGNVPVSDAVKTLEIDWISGSVSIESYDGTELLFNELSDSSLSEATTMHYWIENGRCLHIRFAKSGATFKKLDKFLMVKVPAAWKLEKMEIDNVSADVDVVGVSCDEIELDNVSANVEIRNAAVDKLAVNIVSGSLLASFGDTALGR